MPSWARGNSIRTAAVTPVSKELKVSVPTIYLRCFQHPVDDETIEKVDKDSEGCEGRVSPHDLVIEQQQQQQQQCNSTTSWC
jgi:hypothetical protein